MRQPASPCVRSALDYSEAVDRVRSAAEALDRIEQIEQRAVTLVRQALEGMKAAEARAENAEALRLAAEDQVRAAWAQAEQAEVRANDAERWLAHLYEVVAKEVRSTGWTKASPCGLSLR